MRESGSVLVNFEARRRLERAHSGLAIVTGQRRMETMAFCHGDAVYMRVNLDRAIGPHSC